MKAAAIYERKGMLYVNSLCTTTVGIWMLTPPVLAVDKDNLDGVGRAIMECLLASKGGVPHPKVFTNLVAPLLEVAGVKSIGAFEKLAKCVQVRMDDGGRVTLTPTRNGGSREGFVDLNDKAVVSLNSGEALGAAAVAALAASE